MIRRFPVYKIGYWIKLLVTPESVLGVLLWSFMPYAQCGKKFEFPDIHLPI
jgi:hypothetical protein